MVCGVRGTSQAEQMQILGFAAELPKSPARPSSPSLGPPVPFSNPWVRQGAWQKADVGDRVAVSGHAGDIWRHRGRR